MKRLSIKTRSLVLAVILVLAGFAFPSLVFYPMGELIAVHDDSIRDADAIVLLMGEPSVRPKAAAKAFQDGLARSVVFVKPEPQAIELEQIVPDEVFVTTKVLLKYGVPRDKIMVVDALGAASSTVEEAIILRHYFETSAQIPSRLVLVTSWPHSARARWIFRKVFEGSSTKIEIHAISEIPFSTKNWWKSERGLLFVFEEYVKWARYLIKFGGKNLA